MGVLTNSAMSRGDPAPDAFKPILTPENDVVQGQLVVRLHRDAAAALTASVATRSAATGAPGGPVRLGIGDIDKALDKLKVTAISRLHSPPPPTMVAVAAAAATAVGDTFHIQYAGDTTPEKAARTLANVAGVDMVEAVRYRETLSIIPNDPSFPNQWGLTRVHCPDAWGRTQGSGAITVAVVDTGVDLDHPELQPLLVQGWDFVNLGASPSAPAGFHFEGDFNTPDNVPQDEVGHGTHVAGTIACLSNNGIGVAGVTWACRIMPVRVLARIVSNTNPADVRGTGSSADIAAGIKYATDHGARVINLSLGGPSDTQVERDAIAYAVAHGVVVCAAMGNAFQQGNPTSYPGAYPDVVAVGAIDNADHRAPFSQTGPHIDVCGPGVNVLSTVWDNGYATMSGTSMATPHVAGVAALILSIKPSLTGPQCADILRQTADPLRTNPGDPVPNNDFGWGCVNAFAAVNRASPAVSVPIIQCPSVVTHCPSVPITACPVATHSITCPTVLVAHCPSVVTHCPSIPITTCPVATHSITCPSVLVANCPTHLVTCTVTNPVVCNHPTTLVSCVQTHAVTCAATGSVTCAPSLTVGCPTGPVCNAQTIACGQSIACGGGPGPLQPGVQGFGGDDPYGSSYAGS